MGEFVCLSVNFCQAVTELLSVAEEFIGVTLADGLLIFVGGQRWARGEPFSQAGWARGVGLKKADALCQAGLLEFGVSVSGLCLGQLGELLVEVGLLGGADVDETFALEAVKQDGLLGFVSDDKNFLQGGYRRL